MKFSSFSQEEREHIMEPVPEDQHSMREYGSRYQKLVQKYFKQINVVSGMCSCCKHMFNLLLFGQILGLKLGCRLSMKPLLFRITNAWFGIISPDLYGSSFQIFALLEKMHSS